MPPLDKDVTAPPLRNETTTPLVDVNMVTYNHGKFVAEAIESVLAQQTNFRYRLLIGDDYSTDNTRAIVSDYLEKYPERIEIFFAAKHNGIKHRERVGIKLLEFSTAKYVAWLDGDDYWTNPHKLQRQVDFLESHPDFVISFHNTEVRYEDGKQESWNYCSPTQQGTSTLEDLLVRNFMATSAAVFRRDSLGDLPDWFYKLTMGDWIIHILNAQNGKIGYLNEVMSVYRIQQSGLWSTQDSIQHTLDEIEMFKTLAAYLPKKYEGQIRSHLATLFYKLSEIYNGRHQKVKALINVGKSLATYPRNNTISSRYVIHVLFPGLISRLKSRMGREIS
jgi:glycosyltransferase involved in cell wall biosynthesis